MLFAAARIAPAAFSAFEAYPEPPIGFRAIPAALFRVSNDRLNCERMSGEQTTRPGVRPLSPGPSRATRPNHLAVVGRHRSSAAGNCKVKAWPGERPLLCCDMKRDAAR
jgi:hypothetical protein